uniref:Uncharacterized protein n=1 Tax=Cacopsylla melanoneura TaxID=428564 RepID=A0A8D8RGY5_9HEMI
MLKFLQTNSQCKSPKLIKNFRYRAYKSHHQCFSLAGSAVLRQSCGKLIPLHRHHHLSFPFRHLPLTPSSIFHLHSTSSSCALTFPTHHSSASFLPSTCSTQPL